MSLQFDVRSVTRRAGPLAVEVGVVTAVLIGLSLWRRLVASVLSAVGLPSVGGVPVGGAVGGGLLLVGVVLLAGAYVAVRNIDPGPAVPTRADRAAVAAAVVTPLAFVALTKLVGVATGVPYNALTKTAVAADPPLIPILLLAGLSLFVGVPSLVVICQVIVQGSIGRAVDGDAAIVLTTLVTGFVVVDTTGRLGPIPDRGKLAGVVAFVLLLGIALAGNARADRDWVRWLAAVPVVAFVALVVLSGVAGVDSLVGGLFALSQLATLGAAAYAYDRTDSLLVPALAYASYLLVTRAVVVGFEAGLWS
jgi:hypothetical protein